MMNSNEKALIASAYVKVIEAFKKRSDVMTAKALAYKPAGTQLIQKNWFKYGDALVTTGFCVCVSQALLDDAIFQEFLKFRNAQAKLISIDIKEQFFGFCKPSYLSNKWHTAILLNDSGHWFIIDMTCAQFGNAYVGKVIWDFSTWCETFRSAIDTHVLTDFNDNVIASNLVNIDKSPINKTEHALLKTRLHDDVFSSASEKELLTMFLTDGVNIFNKKALTGELKDSDTVYINHIMDILSKFNLVQLENQYAVFNFESADGLRKFMTYVLEKGSLPFWVKTSPSLNAAEEIGNAVFNLSPNSRQLSIVFRTALVTDLKEYIPGVSGIMPCGVQISFDTETDFFEDVEHKYILRCDVLS